MDLLNAAVTLSRALASGPGALIAIAYAVWTCGCRYFWSLSRLTQVLCSVPPRCTTPLRVTSECASLTRCSFQRVCVAPYYSLLYKD